LAGEEQEFVSWGALHWLVGIFGGFLAAMWWMLMRLIGQKGTKEMQQEIADKVDAHIRDDARQFDSTNVHIHEVEQRAEKGVSDLAERLERRIERSEDRIIDAIKKNGH
jgi:biopolymer transport protein ExbB/TolQ